MQSVLPDKEFIIVLIHSLRSRNLSVTQHILSVSLGNNDSWQYLSHYDMYRITRWQKDLEA